VNIPVFLISNSTLPLKRQGAHGLCFLSGTQEIRKGRRSRGIVLPIAGRPGPWPPRQRLTAPRQTLPALRGGRATRPNAGARDCAPQPWRALTARRSGVPTRLRRVARRRRPAFTAVRIPRRMARPFEWATRRSRVGTDRFGTGPVGTGCGVPTRLRRVARRRTGPARPRIDDDQDFVGFDEARDKA
jgi:hypothetical protein